MNEKMLAVVTDQAVPSRGCMRAVPAFPILCATSAAFPMKPLFACPWC
ncbi:hypothetical protein [Acidovorax sp. SRB_24]|nr:hypothetical protein [Acidovorax sp. SRB_24]